MTLYGPRADLEKALNRALSRYIGYTTGAYDLDRIFGILSEFATKPSAYEIEIINSIQNGRVDLPGTENDELTEDYISEAINFATSLNLIELVSDRNAKIKRYAPTQTGRSIMGAQGLGDPDFFHFYRTKIVLKADADAIVPTLLFSSGSLGAKHRFKEYQRFHKELRERRWSWLQQAFPDKRLLTRVVEQLPWLRRRGRVHGSIQPEEISLNTARHHVTPRIKWLVQLGLAEEPSGHATPWGTAVLQALVGDGEYFWLGPAEGVQEAMHIPKDLRKGGATEDGVQFGQWSSKPSEGTMKGLVESTADMMINSYESAKLVYAPQAPLELPIEYIAYRSYRDEIFYSWHEILAEVFMRYRPRIERLSARKGPIGFYKVKDAGQ